MRATAALPASTGAYLRRQTMLSIIISAVFSAGFFLLIFGDAGRVSVWSPDYFALDFLPQSALASLMSALVPGLQTRAAMARGDFPGKAPTTRSIVLHAILFALLGVACGCAAIAIIWLSGTSAVQWPAAFAIKVAYGGLLGLIITPLAVRAVLAKG